jgi:spore coat protein CotH
MNLLEYLNETLREKFDPSKAKSSVEIENAMNNGDFIVTNDIEFQCKHLSEIECEDLEEAIKQYWDDGGMDWLKLERKGNKFKIYTVGSK